MSAAFAVVAQPGVVPVIAIEYAGDAIAPAEAGAVRIVNFRDESLPNVAAKETDGRGADVIVAAAGVWGSDRRANDHLDLARSRDVFNIVLSRHADKHES